MAGLGGAVDIAAAGPGGAGGAAGVAAAGPGGVAVPGAGGKARVPGGSGAFHCSRFSFSTSSS